MIISNILQVKVDSQCNVGLVPSRLPSALNSLDEEDLSIATISTKIQGTLAISGVNGFRVAHSSLPENRDSWGLSFWIKLMEG